MFSKANSNHKSALKPTSIPIFLGSNHHFPSLSHLFLFDVFLKRWPNLGTSLPPNHQKKKQDPSTKSTNYGCSPIDGNPQAEAKARHRPSGPPIAPRAPPSSRRGRRLLPAGSSARSQEPSRARSWRALHTWGPQWGFVLEFSGENYKKQKG